MKLSLKKALTSESPLQILGVLNPFMAIMAEEVGFQALYLSGAGVSNMSFGLPDTGLTTLDNVLEDARRMTNRTALPLLVDIDTGWEDIGKTIQALEGVGVAAVHLEDQIADKRCGHLAGKQLVSTEEMCERIKAATDAKKSSDFVIMARTDAVAVEGMEAAVKRAEAYIDAGADMLFPEALHHLEDYQYFKKLGVPVLANLTEFGKTPTFTLTELREAHIDMALYPLTISRVMNQAAFRAMKELKNEGTQKDLLPKMMTREELYQLLSYEQQEINIHL